MIFYVISIILILFAMIESSISLAVNNQMIKQNYQNSSDKNKSSKIYSLKIKLDFGNIIDLVVLAITTYCFFQTIFNYNGYNTLTNVSFWFIITLIDVFFLKSKIKALQKNK